MIERTTNRVYVLGDVHGNYQALPRLIPKLEQGSTVIQIGDYGMGFGHPVKQNRIQENVNGLLMKHDIKLYVMRGNHDDPKYFKSTFVSPWPNITFLEDYTTLILNGKKFLAVGGAISIDREDRVEGISYWEDEAFVLRPDYETLPTDYDVLLCHSAPLCAPPTGFSKIRYYLMNDVPLEQDLINERTAIEKLYDHLKPAKFYYGHFHESLTTFIDNRLLRCVDIDEFVEVL